MQKHNAVSFVKYYKLYPFWTRKYGLVHFLSNFQASLGPNFTSCWCWFLQLNYATMIFLSPLDIKCTNLWRKTSIPGKSSWQRNDPFTSTESFWVLRLCTEIQKICLWMHRICSSHLWSPTEMFESSFELGLFLEMNKSTTKRCKRN